LQECQRNELQQKIQHIKDDCNARSQQGVPSRPIDDPSLAADFVKLGGGAAAEPSEAGRYARQWGGGGRAHDGAGVVPKKARKPRKEWSPPRVDPEQVEATVEQAGVRAARREEELTPEQR
jgi:hypothetical protein